MAGGAIKFRHLNRKSSHRQALLRNLVTSLFTHESIRTTWHKAKEAQRLAEKLITLGKKNTNASRRRAEQIFYVRPPSPNSKNSSTLLLRRPSLPPVQQRIKPLISSLGTAHPPPHPLHHPPHPLPHPPRRLHPRPTHRAPKQTPRPSTLSNP